MNKLKSKIFRIITTFLAACGITTTFTACYGMPAFEAELFGYVYGDVNGDGVAEKSETIQGIKVYNAYNPEQYGYTADDGSFNFFATDIIFILAFEDEDGEENGSWESLNEVAYPGPGEYYELKRAQK